MLTFSLMVTSTAFAFSMIMATTPLSMGLWIIMLSLMISLTFNTLSFSWISFLIFLIYIGGLLVMFAYFTAIQPNNFMETTKMLSFFMFTIYLLDFPFDSVSLSPIYMNKPNTLSISSIYGMENFPAMIMTALILSMALVAVVKISKSTKGPLRPFLYV